MEKDRAAIQFKITSYPRLAVICEQFKKDQPGSTSARFKFLDHHLNVLKLYIPLFQFLEDNALWNKIYNGCGAQAPNFVVLTQIYSMKITMARELIPFVCL